jgi:hypothetical protein
MRDQRAAYIFLLSSLLTACGTMREPAQKVVVPDAAPTVGSRYQYAVTVERSSKIPADVLQEKAPEILRAMDFSLQGDVTVTISALTASGYELHWQADITEPAPHTKPGASDDIVRQKHLFQLNLPLDVMIDLRNARPEMSIRNLPEVRQQMFVKVRELLGAKAAEYGCADESEHTRCPLMKGGPAQLESTILSEISPLFACSGRRLVDADLTHWREVRHAADNSIEMAIALNVHDRQADTRARTLRLQLEAIPDEDSYKTTDATSKETTELIRKVLRGTRTTADCTISTTSAMPLDVNFVERVANTNPDVVVDNTVHIQRR